MTEQTTQKEFGINELELTLDGDFAELDIGSIYADNVDYFRRRGLVHTLEHGCDEISNLDIFYFHESLIQITDRASAKVYSPLGISPQVRYREFQELIGSKR